MNNIGIFPRGGELPEMFAEYFSGKRISTCSLKKEFL